MHQKILILDFGAQYTQLIARRVRELNVHSELIAFDTPLSEIRRRNPAGIILSGSPSSVYDADGPKPDAALWTCGIPILGICYGVQLMAQQYSMVQPFVMVQQQVTVLLLGLAMAHSKVT